MSRKLRLVDEDGDIISEWTEDDVRSIIHDYYSGVPWFSLAPLEDWLNAES